MDPFTVSTTIDRPREEIFDYLADIANHQEFSDHYLVDFRMTRIETAGQGAGARFTVKAPFNRFNQADVTFVEVDRPRRIVEAGRAGKFNRVRTRGVYSLEPGPGGTTRVEFTFESRPATVTDRIMESLGGRGWLRRNTARAMRRLRSILEENRDRGMRATIAGG
jgi:uncharacterized protein YndB with AHSA1/START domain